MRYAMQYKVVETDFGLASSLIMMRRIQEQSDVYSTKILALFQSQYKIDSSLDIIRNSIRVSAQSDAVKGLEAADLGPVLDAIAIIAHRCHIYDLYLRTTAKKIQRYVQQQEEQQQQQQQQLAPLVSATDQPATSTSTSTSTSTTSSIMSSTTTTPNFVKKAAKLLRESELNRQVQSMMDKYLIMEQFFMRENVKKAIRMDQIIAGQPCRSVCNTEQLSGGCICASLTQLLTARVCCWCASSTVVDFVFFILHKSLRRAFSTNSPDAVCTVINLTNQCLGVDLRQVLCTTLTRHNMAEPLCSHVLFGLVVC
jgi:hypothetical protein